MITSTDVRSKRARRLRLALLFSLAASCAIDSGAFAQGIGQDPLEEIKSLFRQVEKDLQEIDRLLLQAARDPRAASGEAPEKAGTKAAAKDAYEKQRAVSESIQRIIDLIPPSSSSSQSSPKRDLSKPNQGQGNESQGERQQGSEGKPEEERTARGAGQAPTEPQGGRPSGGRPEGNQKSNEPPQQGKSKPRDYETERAHRARETVERWGDLPEHTRKVFENTNTDDLPIRYRKWIQDFYTRVQQTSGAK